MDKSGEKSREDVQAEREARKTSKLAAKNKAKLKKKESSADENVALKVDMKTNLPNTANKKETNTCTNVILVKNKEIIENEKNIPGSPDSSSDKIIPTDSSKMEKENDSVKSKAQLKAERRAIQEAQRAKKSLQKPQKDEPKVGKQTKENAPKSVSGDNLTVAVQSVKIEIVNKVAPIKDPLANIHKVKLFSHLYKKGDIHPISDILTCNKNVHPAIIKLGLQYQENIIIGSNARCVALLNALKQMICDYKTPTDKDFSRGFENELSVAAVYLDHCRPLSVSMTNAVKHLKWHLMKLPNTISDSDGQNRLQEIIDTYIKEQIETARTAICITAQQKILDNDVILTYGFSSLIEHILNESYQNGKTFKVIIVDSGPLFEGKELLRRLVRKRIQCTYVLLSAVSYIMKEATKVFLGAHALLTNGYVMSRAGASQVALLAHSYNVPVLVCCETHKFSERVQTDAFVYNELGDPEMVIKKELWQSNHYLTPLSLLYDVTPPDLVTAVITEIAILPCTSVPVVLRVKPTESILL